MPESQSFINLAVVTNAKKEVLLIKRVQEEKSETGATLIWAFPGGKQKIGESRKDCIEREVLLETGYHVMATKEISMRFHPEFPVVIVYHLCQLLESEPVEKITEDWEVAETKWVKPNEIKNLFTSDLDPKVAKELGI